MTEHHVVLEVECRVVLRALEDDRVSRWAGPIGNLHSPEVIQLRPCTFFRPPKNDDKLTAVPLPSPDAMWL